MTKEEIVDGLELYTAGRPLKDQVSITVQELQNFVDAIKALEQEPCEDAVSRKEVFETFGELLGVWGRKALMELPSVTPVRKEWIPCSEGLPKDGEEILMNTVHFGVLTGIYDSEPGFMTHYSLSSADMAVVEVIAWMPLPEPYEEEEG